MKTTAKQRKPSSKASIKKNTDQQVNPADLINLAKISKFSPSEMLSLCPHNVVAFYTGACVRTIHNWQKNNSIAGEYANRYPELHCPYFYLALSMEYATLPFEVRHLFHKVGSEKIKKLSKSYAWRKKFIPSKQGVKRG